MNRIPLTGTLMAMTLAACSPTIDGVAYNPKSPKDLQKLCEASVSEIIAETREFITVSQGDERSSLRLCCKTMVREGGNLSEVQRTWAWYEWDASRSVERKASELEKSEAIRTALRSLLSEQEAFDAQQPRSGNQACLREILPGQG